MNHSRPAAQALLMACLGMESRFRLVQALIGGARCVTDLAAEVGLSQSCTTRHLQALERRQVVCGRRDGKRVLYRIREEDPGLLPLLGWALNQPVGPSGVRTRRMARKGVASPDGPRPYPPQQETGAARRSDRPESAPPAPLPSSARRAGGSDIEDYLL